MKHLKNEELLSGIVVWVRREKESTSKVLEYLSEIDRRRLWQSEAYSSLYDFCVRYLNYSEGEANRRIQACRVSERVQELKPLLKNNELSLTALSTIAPHITKENAKEIIPRIINQPVREVEKVILEMFPEAAKKPRYFEAELDEELDKLLEEAKKKASEKDHKALLKKVLRAYVKPTATRATTTKSHTNYVQVAMRKSLSERDNYQCTYTSSSGTRCNQTAHLQVDHIRPYGLGGSSKDINNLRLLCRTHNLYKAKVDYPVTKLPWTRGLNPSKVT